MRSDILWRCRRGTRELDLLLECFYKNCPADMIDNFTELLSETDDNLIAWLLEDQVPPLHFAQTIRAIISSYKL